MIRNAVLHLANEQPLLADLFSVPGPTDQGLLCTNLRMLDGKRPVFIDHIAATFFFPYRGIRFLEIPPGAIERHVAETGDPAGVAGRTDDAGAGDELRLPVAVTGGDGPSAGDGDLDLDLELDIDEDFLQRVRDI